MTERIEELLLQLFRDPRYVLRERTESFGDPRLAYMEMCMVISATGDVIGQTLLHREFRERGRPDGERPHGHDSLLDYYQHEQSQNRVPVLSHEACARIREESWQYYVRRNFHFQLKDFTLAREDGEHNLELCNLMQRYAVDETDRWALLRWWPWIERDRAMAAALELAEAEQLDMAAAELYRAAKAIDQYAAEHAAQYAAEGEDGTRLCPAMRSHVEALTALLREDASLPVSADERLDEALASGDQEEAERLRRAMMKDLLTGG
jgi:hypothetical protein